MYREIRPYANSIWDDNNNNNNMKNRSDLYSVPSKIRTGPTDGTIILIYY